MSSNASTILPPTVDDYDIHFIREDGSGDNPETLLMTHGWPGSVYEFIDVIDRLAHPENHGGDAEDGVTVICPSFAGLWFSSAPAGAADRPDHHRGPVRQADARGAGLRHLYCARRRLGQSGNRSFGPQSRAEQRWRVQSHSYQYVWLAKRQAAGHRSRTSMGRRICRKMQAEGAYLQLQATKPQSLALAMTDSPLGIAAWLIEKFHGWSDIFTADGRQLDKRYSKHQLLSQYHDLFDDRQLRYVDLVLSRLF